MNLLLFLNRYHSIDTCTTCPFVIHPQILDNSVTVTPNSLNKGNVLNTSFSFYGQKAVDRNGMEFNRKGTFEVLHLIKISTDW